jgi:hypothetical protein
MWNTWPANAVAGNDQVNRLVVEAVSEAAIKASSGCDQLAPAGGGRSVGLNTAFVAQREHLRPPFVAADYLPVSVPSSAIIASSKSMLKNKITPIQFRRKAPLNIGIKGRRDDKRQPALAENHVRKLLRSALRAASK